MTTPDSPVDGGSSSGDIGFAGICLQAQDTGRVLLLQRSLADPEDPNAGLWEFPGGALEPGEDPYEGACREFGEEVGVPVPEDAQSGGASWDLPPDAPKYRLHLLTVPGEDSIDLNSNEVQNPDDPNGLNVESLAFWDPAHIQGDHIRPEVQDTMKTVGDTLTTPAAAVAAGFPNAAPPFTKKSAPAAKKAVPPKAKAAPVDAPVAAEQKAVELLGKAADMATDPALKKIIAEAVAALQPADAVVAATPPASPSPPGPPTEKGTSPSDVTDTQKVVDLLEQVEAAMAEPNADPAAVSDLVTSALAILDPTEDTADESDAMIASAAPVAPPDEWFQPFDLDGPTPLTVTADGRVFGHLATWDSCHRSGQYGNKCMRPPSDPKAPFFQMGEVLTASGASVNVGVVTVGGGHASKDKGLIAALEHYDDVSTAAATVVVQEDDYGIGLFGSVVPDAEPSKVAALRRSPLSGDWRKEKGHWRLVAAHAVNTPGFPITRGLVASIEGGAFFTTGRVEPKTPVVDLRAAANRLARSAGLDTESLVASARQSMAEIDCGCDDEEPALVASLIGDTTLPVASYDMPWDGGAAADRVFSFYTKGGVVDPAGVSKAFLWRDTTQPDDQKSGYDLPFADIVDGALKIVPRGVQACAGGHGVAQLNASDADKSQIQNRIGELYATIKKTFPDAPDNPYAKENS